MTEQPTPGAEGMDTLPMPIFPLGLVLFPGAKLPLKIFEQRYLEMTKACVRDNSVFGVCCILHGQEVGAPAEHAQIGCSARIAEWDMPHPNLFHLMCTGERVFRVLDLRIESNGLITGTVQWLTSDTAGVDANSFDVCRNALESFAKQAGETIFAGPPQFDDPEWVSYRLSEFLPIDWQRKQALLEQRSTAQRLAAISRMLQPA
ncbi:MAG: LON peptidase substrate-binding domain-containing protein [Betaproteobacteria bacterium]|nr:MAG: LON peptidase substrate-binding domain-containing protein [Betaproteobacteria bacterium]